MEVCGPHPVRGLLRSWHDAEISIEYFPIMVVVVELVHVSNMVLVLVDVFCLTILTGDSALKLSVVVLPDAVAFVFAIVTIVKSLAD